MNFLKKLFKHKILLGLLAVIVIGGGYYAYTSLTAKSAPTRYVTAAAEKGTLIITISGTGQVSTSNQIDLKPKASGDVVSVNVAEGQDVKAGAVIAQLDASTAYKAVRDAQANLESAKLALDKLQQPAGALTLIQNENALTLAQQAKDKAISDLATDYDDAFTAISNAFLELPDIVTGINNILYTKNSGLYQYYIDYYYDLVKTYDQNASSYRDNAAQTYQTARAAYDQNFIDYKNTSRYAEVDKIDTLLNETYTTVKSIAEAVKSSDNYLSFVKDKLTQNAQPIPAIITTQQANLVTYTDKINSNLASLLGSINAISNTKNTLSNSDLTIKEKTQSLADLKAGTSALDLQSAQLSVKQRQNALLDARQALADYTVRAPFDGTIASVSVKKYDSASSGTAVATLITKQKIAEMSFNEIDAAKIKTGQKATLTFDAIPDLSITGKVVEVDTLGTVSSGVVSYGTKIAFDVQDERIKPGMSLSVDIVIESKTDVLLVPVSAVKTSGNESYVQILVDGAPQNKTVTTGLGSDTQVEITEGLAAGDQVITQTITGTSAQSSTSANTNRASNGNAMRGIMQLEGGGGPPH